MGTFISICESITFIAFGGVASEMLFLKAGWAKPSEWFLWKSLLAKLGELGDKLERSSFEGELEAATRRATYCWKKKPGGSLAGFICGCVECAHRNFADDEAWRARQKQKMVPVTPEPDELDRTLEAMRMDLEAKILAIENRRVVPPLKVPENPEVEESRRLLRYYQDLHRSRGGAP